MVESVRASGPGYNVRVEEALRAAGFGIEAATRGEAQADERAPAQPRRRSRLYPRVPHRDRQDQGDGGTLPSARRRGAEGARMPAFLRVLIASKTVDLAQHAS